MSGPKSGMNKLTGKTIDGLAHIAQSITDILTTPLGSRVMRRDYGSELFKLLDAAMNTTTFALIRAAIAEAIAKWEPRIRLTRILISDPAATGSLNVSLEAVRIDQPQPQDITLQISL